jgi:hypothetical protein
MVSVSFVPDGSIRLSIHEDFLQAPPRVRRALRTYLRSRRRSAWNIVAAYAEMIPTQYKACPATATAPVTGRAHNLSGIARLVNQEFFNGRVKCNVVWGKAQPKRKRRRSIRYGSWDAATRTVRVNPLLDDSRIPADFLRYIVFHEMLHSIVPDRVARGRRQPHSAQFRSIEKTFPEFDRMKQLCGELLDLL